MKAVTVMKYKVLNILFWFWLIITVVLSIIPKTPDSRVYAWGIEFRLDYAEHLIFYFVLGMLFVKSKRQILDANVGLKVLIIFIWVIFGVLTEYVQKLVPGRSFNPNDMYYNITGLITGLMLTAVVLQLKSNSGNQSVPAG